MHSRKRHLQLIGAAVVLLVLICLIGVAIRARSRLSAEADQINERAKQFASQGTTYQGAKSWLEYNGFTVAYRNWVFHLDKADSAGHITTFNGVRGYRRLGSTPLSPGGYWISMVFVFKDEDLVQAYEKGYTGGDLLDVDLQKNSEPPPLSAQHGF